MPGTTANSEEEEEKKSVAHNFLEMVILSAQVEERPYG